MDNTTIAAIATPLSVGALGVVRISGPAAKSVAAKIFQPIGRRTVENVPGYSGIYGRLCHGGEVIDEVVAFVFTAPKSYTGEDVVEISCHGGVFVLTRVLRAVLESGALPAQPGEFTKRAFLNGKMKLTEAEAVMDLISARGAAASRAAISAREGALSRRIDEICGEVLAVVAHMGAWVDYPDEEIEELDNSHITEVLTRADSALETLLNGYDCGRILREGVTTAIIGKPNVGKSTLMNMLLGVQRSIVTDIPGTTRDVVEESVRLDEDLVLNLADTAGIRHTTDPIEAIGVLLANQKLEGSALILAVFDGSAPPDETDLLLASRLKGRAAVAIINKSDLPMAGGTEALEKNFTHIVNLSAKHEQGAAKLTAAIRDVLRLAETDTSAPMLANERQRNCAIRAKNAIADALSAMEMGTTLDAVNVCLDEALEAMLEIDGKSVSAAVTNEIFANFCVGK